MAFPRSLYMLNFKDLYEMTFNELIDWYRSEDCYQFRIKIMQFITSNDTSSPLRAPKRMLEKFLKAESCETVRNIIREALEKPPENFDAIPTKKLVQLYENEPDIDQQRALLRILFYRPDLKKCLRRHRRKD